MGLLEFSMNHADEKLEYESELGQKSTYDATYNPQRLYPISRESKRQELGIDSTKLPFYGYDCWNHYEVSWLNPKGKPVVAIAEIIYDCQSPKIIESKSLKLYFNSFNNAKMTSFGAVEELVKKDLQERLDTEVLVKLTPLSQSPLQQIATSFSGECLDELDITCDIYQVEPLFLKTSEEEVTEVLYSDLLKSNCLVTQQPDWGSVQISYSGKKIDREGLLKYLVSFRNHNEFHEQCIERIFMDLQKYCRPHSLTVYGRYTRRGGLDINPFRSTEKCFFMDKNQRLIRQ